MLHEFVEKVVVFEADKSSGIRQQRVDIYLNYIGQFEVPEDYEDEMAGEPALPMTPTEIQRAKWREYARVGRKRKRAAKLAQEQERLQLQEQPSHQITA